MPAKTKRSGTAASKSQRLPAKNKSAPAMAKSAKTKAKVKIKNKNKNNNKNTLTTRNQNRKRLGLTEVMAILNAAGSEQTRKTYRRHGAKDPMFGVSFAELKKLVKQIGVDHELATALWETDNSDAQTLAIRIADPAALTSAELDRWVTSVRYPLLVQGVGQLAAEGMHAQAKARKWLSMSNEQEGLAAWALVSHLAFRDETLDDKWFLERLAEIKSRIHEAPNRQRAAMNSALITIGCRNEALRKAALVAAGSIGSVEVDHGDTACKTPDAAAYIEKAWAHSLGKGFSSPAAHERSRENVRTRC